MGTGQLWENFLEKQDLIPHLNFDFCFQKDWVLNYAQDTVPLQDRAPCACKSNCHSPSMDCLQDFDGVVLFHLRKFPPRKSQGQPSATSDWSLITSNICNPKKMSWQHESLIHWDDVSRYILIGAQNIAGYGTCLGLGRSKTETRTEPLHETSITVPSTSLNYLGTCQKYHCCAFKRKMS